jgi:hypothetical protein
MAVNVATLDTVGHGLSSVQIGQDYTSQSTGVPALAVFEIGGVSLVCCMYLAPGSQDLYMYTYDGRQWTVDPGSNPVPKNQSSSGGALAVFPIDGQQRLCCIYKGTDITMYLTVYDGQQWSFGSSAATPIPNNQTSAQPAVAVYTVAGTPLLCCAYLDATASNQRLYLTTSPDGQNWTTCQIPGVASNFPPALAAYSIGGTPSLCCAYTDPSGALYMITYQQSTVGGTIVWSQPSLIPLIAAKHQTKAHQTSASPALAVCDDLLLCFYQDDNFLTNPYGLWMTSFDGSAGSWDGSAIRIHDLKAFSAPALIGNPFGN